MKKLPVEERPALETTLEVHIVFELMFSTALALVERGFIYRSKMVHP